MSQVIVQSAHQIFVNCVLVIGISFIWSLMIFPALFVFPWPAAMLFLVFTAMPATAAGCAVFGQVILQEEKYKLGDFFHFFLHYYFRSLGFGMIIGIAAVIIGTQWWYYFAINHHYLMFVFSVFQTYLCLAFVATQIYTLPFLIMDDCSLFQAMNRSIQHFMRHIGYTLSLFIQLICMTLLLAFTVIGFFLLFIGMCSVFLINAAQNIQLAEQKTVSAAHHRDYHSSRTVN
ncbi:MAG: DUF624 domain-containing protein [Sporolactobacillus sp.]|jgi:uncharacterized membrane protein YesL|nr:DUF624 domain-containing protein [Sporolactobacillus sp.]MCI1881902.1 DUF624 domain-containing protein [Sporolactobacillus sp.]